MNDLFPAFPTADLAHHRRQIDIAMRRTLDSGRYILGEEVAAFEEEFAQYLGVPHVIALASGTDAVELMLRAHDLGIGDQVVLPSHAPSAIASAVRRSGADLLLADVDPVTMTLCPDSLASLLALPTSNRARAVVAVHLYGHPVAWEALQKVATQFGLILLEDAAQAHGAEYWGRKVGGLGTAAAFSFYPTKNLGAMGDAGALATHDSALADRIRALREYGWCQRYVSTRDGINSRMDELQAAILRVKLHSLTDSVKKRRDLARYYSSKLAKLDSVTLPIESHGSCHAFHQFVIRSPRQQALLTILQQHGIPAAIHYPAPLHQQPAYETKQQLPNSESAATQVLSLPIHPYLTTDALDAVCSTLEQFRR